MQSPTFFLNKIESLRMRAKALTKLRQEIALPPERDLTTTQWESLEGQLQKIATQLMQKLKTYADQFLADSNRTAARVELVNLLGNLEMELTQAYTFYDTYMDMLTQRLSKPIGTLLKGCDAIAMDGTHRSFLAEITVPPIVFCDKGFGASTCREGVAILPNTPNPMQFIAVPYSRLVEKYNLISVYHEVGHQTLKKLNLLGVFKKVLNVQLKKANASLLVQTLFNNWANELAPDFWAFCLTGMAHTCSLRDILFLDSEQSFYISASQTHPPGYIRFLVSVHWCKHLWGKGDWDAWETDWKQKYPTHNLDTALQNLIKSIESYLPLIAKIFCDTRYAKLDNKPISSLFTLEKLHPNRLKKLSLHAAKNSPLFTQEPIGVQLAAFRLLRENRQYKLSFINQLMTAWLQTI